MFNMHDELKLQILSMLLSGPKRWTALRQSYNPRGLDPKSNTRFNKTLFDLEADELIGPSLAGGYGITDEGRIRHAELVKRKSHY